MTASAPLPLGIPARSRLKPRPAFERRPGRLPLLAATVIAASALAASPAMAKKRQPDAGFEATLPAPAPVSRPADGSIFSASSYSPLYGGTRASRVGDALTILLVESTTAAKTVGSKSQKGGGMSVTPPKSGPFSFNPDALTASSSSNFNGSGNASQTNSLTSTLSVTIAEVRPNGTALVKGQKRLLISQGNEWVQISGIVRLIDIDQNNTILSSQVADAHIEYTGKGALQQASKQGWLGRIFNIISPF
ncbi:MAG TPA: flagellar basal body L-ring protein FlgH [Novosphingobium sp.]